MMPIALADGKGLNLWDVVLRGGVVAKVVLVVLLFFSLLSWFVILQKTLLYNRSRGVSDRFRGAFRRSSDWRELRQQVGAFTLSPMVGLFNAGYTEVTYQLKGGVPGQKTQIRSMEAVERSLQRATVVEPPVVYTTATALGPDVKQAIADEVHRQMEREREAQVLGRDDTQPDPQPSIFTDRGPRVFLVANNVLAYAGGQDCALMEGDVLQLLGTPSPSAEMADVRVLASRGGSCRKGSVVSVRLTDLQEMQNHLRATLDQGMTTLQSEQGRNGLPTLPSHAAGTVATAYANEVRPDADAADQISQVVQDANRSEQDMIEQGPPDPGGRSTTISLGMTLADVERAMGRPKNTVDLGSKKIYVYKDLKITFLNGRVSDVQ